METKTRRRRSIKSDVPKLGKESWQIVGPDGEILRDLPHGESVTLGLAQMLAMKWDEKVKVVELIVRLKTLFGPPDPLFRVVRDSEGVVTTHGIQPS